MALATDVVLVKATVAADALEGVAQFRDWLGATPALAGARTRCFVPTASAALYL